MRKSIDLTVTFGSHRIYKPNPDASSSSTHKTTLSSIYPMAELLIDLRRILDEAIETIISVCERRNEDFPHLDTPADPSEFSPEGIRNDPEVAQAIKLGVAAASHLVAALQSPIQAVANVGFVVRR